MRLAKLLATSGLGLVSAAGAAVAQEAPASGGGIEEIVITAQRREETAQRAALAITAVSAETLDQRGISNAEDLPAVVPGLQVGGNGTGSVEVNIRGIGSTNNTEIGDPAVAFNVDGVYMARPRAASGVFYDVQRIEVLRGPQGTLYGRNATAGGVNVITNGPSHEFQGGFQIEVGDYDRFRASGVLNAPVTDQLMVRGAFQMQQREGYTDNSPVGDYNDEQVRAARLSVLWEPTSTFSIHLTGDAFENSGNGPRTTALGLGNLDGDLRTSPVETDGDLDQTNWGLTATVAWDLPFATLTYIGAYREDEFQQAYGDVQTALCNIAAATPCADFFRRSLDETTSHELRLSHDGERIDWVVGLYRLGEQQDIFFRVANAAPGLPPFFGNPGIGVAPNLTFDQPDVSAESQAAFAQATVSLTDDFRVTGGVRYTEDQKARTGHTYVSTTFNPATGVFACTRAGGFGTSIFFGGPPGGAASGCLLATNVADFAWESTDWRAGLEYDLAPASLLYFSAATGYKAGGFSDGVAPFNGPYDPETLMSYELGLKNRLFDNRVQANLAVFFYDYQDFQVTALGPSPGGGTQTITVNAQQAELRGAEFEGVWLATDDDRFELNIAYLSAEYTEFVLPLGDPFFVAPAVYSGLDLARSPEWTLSGGYEHTWNLGGGAAVMARVNTRYVSEQNLDYHNFAVTAQEAFTRTDVSLTFESANGQWSIMAYGRNLEDEDVLVYGAPESTPGGVSRLHGQGALMPPRTYGIQIGAHF